MQAQIFLKLLDFNQAMVSTLLDRTLTGEGDVHFFWYFLFNQIPCRSSAHVSLCQPTCQSFFGKGALFMGFTLQQKVNESSSHPTRKHVVPKSQDKES